MSASYRLPPLLPLSGLAGLLLLLACTRTSAPGGATPGTDTPAPAAMATAMDTAQGIAGTLEALGGARLPDPGCETLAEPARDSCERAFLRQMTWPLKGTVVVRAQDGGRAGDSVSVPLDSLGRYRIPLSPGRYRLCVRSPDLEGNPNLCQDSIRVEAGTFTPWSRPFPMP